MDLAGFECPLHGDFCRRSQGARGPSRALGRWRPLGAVDDGDAAENRMERATSGIFGRREVSDGTCIRFENSPEPRRGMQSAAHGLARIRMQVGVVRQIPNAPEII